MKQQRVFLVKSITFKVIDPFGLHARSTGKFLRFLDENKIQGTLQYKESCVKLDSILDIMRLNIGYQDQFTIDLDEPIHTLPNMDHLLSQAGLMLCS